MPDELEDLDPQVQQCILAAYLASAGADGDPSDWRALVFGAGPVRTVAVRYVPAGDLAPLPADDPCPEV
jgi:hypothetical protein